MTVFDGLYRYRGASLVWDDVGLTFSVPSDGVASHVDWSEVHGVRQIGARPGVVQLIVRNHVPPSDPRQDPFSISVASDADANRLVTAIGWRTVPQQRSIWSRRSRI